MGDPGRGRRSELSQYVSRVCSVANTWPDVQRERGKQRMRKIIGAFLLMSTCFFVSCKSISISDEKHENLNHQDNRFAPSLPPSKSGQFLAARQAQFNGDSVAAGFYFDQALSRDSGNLMLWEQSFLSNYQSGNLKRAAEIATELEELGSEFSLSSEPALSIAVNSNDWEAVIALSEKISLTDQGYIFASGLRSLALIGLGEPETALQEQQRMINLIINARIDIPREILALQKAYFAEITGASEEAISLYKSINLNNKNTGYTLIAVTAGLWRLGAHDSAEAILRQYQAGDLDSEWLLHLFKTRQTELLQPLNLRQLFAHFIFEINWFGRLPSGQSLIVPRIHLALSMSPALDLGHLILAQTYFELPDYKRSVDYLDQITGTSPYFNQAIMLKMEIAHLTGNAESAFLVAENALTELTAFGTEAKFAQEKALILQHAGTIARREELYHQAIDYFEQALALGRKTNFNYRNLGISYERIGQVELAENALQKALQLNPDDALTLNYIGYWWADENRRIEEALELIKKAVNLQPTSGYFADSLGWAYFRQDDFNTAVLWLEKAIQLAPADPVIADHLGDAYWKVGRFLEARFKWQRALDMEIEDKYATVIAEKIINGLE